MKRQSIYTKNTIKKRIELRHQQYTFIEKRKNNKNMNERDRLRIFGSTAPITKISNKIPINVQIESNIDEISNIDFIKNFKYIIDESIKQSIIISYKESYIDRKINLMKLLDYLSWLLNGKTEIILVEQDSKSKVDWLSTIKGYKDINHIFVKNDGVFNKGWGYNIGVKAAKGDYLVFSDSDLFLKLNTYRITIDLLDKFDIINPYKILYYLNKEKSKLFMSNDYDFNVVKTLERTYNAPVISGGVFMMKKNKYLELKGFDEDCYGWGGEDDIFDFKIKKMNLLLYNVNDIAVHVFHEDVYSKNNKNEYYSFRDKNILLVDKYKNMSINELKNKINSIESFGEINKNSQS
ncbi:MAG: glycosyltransferase [Candidatus Paceibacterota bacterium]|jgi:hypothetical protein